MITPLPKLTTPSPAPTTVPTMILIPTLPNFSSLFGFDQRVSTLEMKLSQLKQADHSAQLLKSIKSQLPTMVDDLLTMSLTEFKLKKILLDKIKRSKSYQAAPEHRELYDGLVKSYNLNKDLFLSYGNTSKEAEPPKGSKSKESKTSSSKGTNSEPKPSGNKPLPLIKDQGHQVVPVEYFFNNNFEYLKGGSSSRKYTTSTTKTKAAKYDNIEGIEDMVLTLWSPVKVAYNKFAMWVTYVKVMKWYDYSYLEEIIVRREDQTLHKFKKGDFLRLNLRNIKDLLILLVQKKLFNLEKDVIFDLHVALWMFTRRVVILKRVKDHQLESKATRRRLISPSLRLSDLTSPKLPHTLHTRTLKFEMSMIGELKFFLGIQIHQSPRDIFINQAKYAQEILIKHGMTSCDSAGTPMAMKHLDAYLSGTPVDQTKYQSMVGALMYIIASKPDIMYATCYCARYQEKPTEKHLTVVKRIFWYLKDTINMRLWYLKDTGFELTAFSDSDHAGCLDSRKSTSGGIQFLSGDKLLTDYGFHFDKIPMYCDSNAAIAISCNPVQHSHTKHIDVRYHFIKEKVEKGIVELFFVGTEYQLADLFTKALSEDRFRYLLRRLGMRCLTPEELKVLANESA
nr:hypothetical protein [Tanacetum cinerariifolium]